MLFIECDITSEEQVKVAIAQIEQTWNGIDILVNSAAIPHPHGLNDQQETRIEEWTTWECRVALFD